MDRAISVVIPVFNVERYLKQCLDSVAAQTLELIEVICVNDGSTDSSASILHEYAEIDPRFVIIDKINEGYGKAVNTGLEYATGEYIAIIEPDDFIDKSMLYDLYDAAHLGDGQMADMVKSSYWNFYDIEATGEKYIDYPNLALRMPKEKMVFSIESSWEVLYHHPSIWSAIYRRDFLLSKRIRMIEPRGAGWSDNPFFFETICQATSIVWVPYAYYYYRQTNPDSSSYLSDYHLPFDRLKDIRALLDRLEVENPHVLICLYNREFSYIKSVLEKFNFPESDPILFSLIRETLESMDQKLLFSAKQGIHRDSLDYYMDVMGMLADKVSVHDIVQSPEVSIILSVKNGRPYVWKCLESLSRQSLESIEVICIDCNSDDRSRELISNFTSKDRRFSLIELDETSYGDGYNAGLSRAKGKYVYFADLKSIYPKDFMCDMLRALKAYPQVDFLISDPSLDYVNEVSENQTDFMMAAYGSRDRLMLVGENAIYCKLYKKSFIDDNGLYFSSSDNASGVLFSMNSIMAATLVAFFAYSGARKQSYRTVSSPLALLPTNSVFSSLRAQMFDSLYECAKNFDSDELMRGFRCYVVSAIRKDIASLNKASEIMKYVAFAKNMIEKYEINYYSGKYFINFEDHQFCCRIFQSDSEKLLESELLIAKREVEKLRNKLESTKSSFSYRFGNKFVRLGKKIVPKRLARYL